MRILPILMTATALSACTVGKDYKGPAVALSARYAAPANIAPAEEQWWRRFGDSKLDALVERALAQNLDLAAVAARIDQARATARAAEAALLPTINADASVDRVHQSFRTPVGGVADRLNLPRDYSLYQIGEQASWELDLFGGLRRNREATRADLGGAQAEAAAARLSISAETVDTYLQLRGLQARYDVASHQLQNEIKLVELVRQQTDQGLVAEHELNRVLGEKESLEASLAPLRTAMKAQINRLDVLTGRQAGVDPDGLAATAKIPEAPDPSGNVEPADLMRRRPDVVAAERRLAAANARIGVALAEYYPKISLSGLFGVASIGTGGLFTGEAVQVSGGGALRWRLFDFGRIDAEVTAARGHEAEALAQYRGSILRATEEVENALTKLAETRTEIATRTREVAALARSRDQARRAYEGGILALVAVLDADRALLEASDRLAKARAEAGRASVSATRALGGGWEVRS
ncbi:efflux transporter outer membrane subunit [Acetobacteraceae bacterium H6797]|nr:efflux transporter outer membrane subunit [Acetobacteraceae bacterium H6797]